MLCNYAIPHTRCTNRFERPKPFQSWRGTFLAEVKTSTARKTSAQMKPIMKPILTTTTTTTATTTTTTMKPILSTCRAHLTPFVLLLLLLLLPPLSLPSQSKTKQPTELMQVDGRVDLLLTPRPVQPPTATPPEIVTQGPPPTHFRHE
jgi:hypothetical protein